jgi:hypothetical protein
VEVLVRRECKGLKKEEMREESRNWALWWGCERTEVTVTVAVEGVMRDCGITGCGLASLDDGLVTSVSREDRPRCAMRALAAERRLGGIVY